MFAADTETCLIRRGLKVPPLVCVSWCEPNYEALPSALPGEVVGYRDAHDLCRMLFEGESIWANAAYDLAVIGNQYNDLVPLIFDALENDRVDDIIIRQRLIDIAHGQHYGYYRDGEGNNVKITYSVAAIAKRLLGIDMEKDEWRLKYGTLREVPVNQWPKGAIHYSKFDAEVLIPIWMKQQEHEEILLDQYRQVRADMALHLASAWGVRTHRPSVEEIDRRTEAEFYELQRVLIDESLVNAKKGSRNTKHAKNLLREHLPKDRIKLTHTGWKKMSSGQLTREEAIEAGYVSLDEESCMSSGHPGLQAYARYGAVLKLRSTYVNAMWDGVELPLQPRFLVLVDTGRTSCSDPNLQNLPREPGIRECITARDGCALVGCDYDKAELISLAESCKEFVGYSRMGDRLIEGEDPHADMGAQIVGRDPKEYKVWKKEGAPIVQTLNLQLGVKKVKFPERSSVEEIFEHVRNDYGVALTQDQLMWLQRFDMMKWSRQMAKAANFGFPGGLGPETFTQYAKASYGVDLTIDQAAELRRTWHRAWPEMQDYFNFVNGLLDDGRGFIVQPISHRYRGGVSYTQCCNSFFQQRTADGAKAATWEVTRRQFTVPSSALYGTHIVNFVHDEDILEVPVSRCHEVAVELRQVMIEQFQRFHPHMAKAVNASPVAMYYWSKDAEATYDENKRLIPWGEPRLLDAA